MQQATQSAYVSSSIRDAIAALNNYQRWKWKRGNGNEGSSGEQKEVNLNRTWTFGNDHNNIDMNNATAGGGNMTGYAPSSDSRYNEIHAVGNKIHFGGDGFSRSFNNFNQNIPIQYSSLLMVHQMLSNTVHKMIQIGYERIHYINSMKF
jgi:hypothetical protein